MAPNGDTDHEHQHTSDSTSNPSVDNELVTHKDKSVPSVTMQDQDHTNIMHELAILVGSNRNMVQELSMIWSVTLMFRLVNLNHQCLNPQYIRSQR